jgi:hypothetical protein
VKQLSNWQVFFLLCGGNVKLIHSEDFAMTVEHFRALMQRLVIQYAKGWESADGKRLTFGEYRHTKQELVGVTPGSPRYMGRYVAPAIPDKHYRYTDVTPPTRGSWLVSPLGNQGFAGIEAYEQPGGSTKVDFYDGYHPAMPGLDHPAIGAALEGFCETVVKAAQAACTGQVEPQADSGAVAEQLKPDEGEDSSLIKILFLAANPADRDRLRLDAEMRDIDLALRQTAFRDRFDIKMHGAVRAADLQGYLLQHKPDIVHFSGHGDPSSEIVLENSSGKSHPVSVRALSKLFSALKDNIRCVVLNACYSEQQAKAIAEHIDCVIGMSKAIGDKAAIRFAVAFYQALGYGKSVQTAFDLGCAQIDLENLGEQDTPKLLALNKDPETVVFVHDSSK